MTFLRNASNKHRKKTVVGEMDTEAWNDAQARQPPAENDHAFYENELLLPASGAFLRQIMQ
ncbi:hypothetical protein M2447_001992 [Ereboglobus sp. PH5-10]|uniref:hypothetical protein n=1 Tax=Ereboglobus sp. PH5-10 TaxID=2940629 RepID=UPI002405821D|nr:hypothetical protein [Ereboglobus sp. PH5-10]MDF9827887.1 hypothetical protein [Ereboglobus sp. PH5-10]